MKGHMFITGALLLWVTAAGCKSKPKAQAEEPIDEAIINRALVRSAFDQNVRSGVLAQRTVYPYHFVEGSSQLNELGESQIEILAGALQAGTAEINVSRGGVAAKLYEARIDTVRLALVDAGLDPAKMVIADHTPGGLGMRSDDTMGLFEEKKFSLTQSEDWSRDASRVGVSGSGGSGSGGR